MALLVGMVSFLAVVWFNYSDMGVEHQVLPMAYAVSPRVIALQFEPHTVTYAQQHPYRSSWLDGQQVIGQDLWVVRGWQRLGTLVSPTQNILYPFDRYTNLPVNIASLDRPNNYRIQSDQDLHYQDSLHPKAVHRKSQPVDTAELRPGRRRWPLRHTLYLELPESLVSGQTYQIQVLGLASRSIAPISFQYQPGDQISEAIHVSHIGFRPDDPIKVGFLSTWMGTGGKLDYPEGLPFRVVNEASNQAIFWGKTTLRKRSDEIEDPRGRTYTLANVYQLDFSLVNQPGQYHLCVEGIGCSMAFPIADTAWQDAFYIAARGFYHQRSGIALGPPYTEVMRPRPFHPDDGMKVYQSTTPLMDTGNGLNAQGSDSGNFANLVEGKTDQIVPNAWGGYFDAGDWDRRIQHLKVARSLLELLELFPSQFETFSLNLPESENQLPDILDEALWGIDFFKRLQTPDGGIRGGIESAAHPKRGEASWQESLPVMAYAPGPWSSYIYAGVAARVARLLERYDAAKAIAYRQSALTAMAFAERAHQTGIQAQASALAVIESDRALAALELYQLTGDSHWHQRFLDAQAEVEHNPDTDYRSDEPWRDIAFLYAQLPTQQVEPQLQQRLRADLLQQAQASASLAAATAFGWTKLHPMIPVGWGGGLGAPRVTTLLRAHALTGNQAYLEAALLGSQFSAGANPGNMTFTTGLGHRSPRHPLVIDQRVIGEPPPPGITVYGPIDKVDYGDYWMFDVFDAVTVPPARQWPTVETYFDVFAVPAINEFTVMQSMIDAAYAWGYLSARNNIK